MKKRALLFTASIVLILATMVALTGCPSPTAAAAPGTLTATLTNAAAADDEMFIVGIFNIGDDPQTATPLGSVAAFIVSGTASDVVYDELSTDIIFPAGTYQFTVLINVIDATNPPAPDVSGEKYLLTNVTIDGDTTFTVDYTGTGFITVP